MQTSRRDIRAKQIELTGLGWLATATAGGSDYITSTELASYSMHIPGGAIVMPRAGLCEGQIRWVRKFERATGKLTISPDWDANTAPACGDTLEVWLPVIETLSQANNALNRALTERCCYWKIVPLSLLEGGDCQTLTKPDGVTEIWQKSAGAGSGTKAELTELSYPDRFARYALKVTSEDGAKYMYQAAPVKGSRTYVIAVAMQVPADTTGSVEIYDVPGAAPISLVAGSDTLSVTGQSAAGSGWVLLQGSFSTPATCDRIEVRLKNSGTAGVVHFAFISLWPFDGYALPLPDRVGAKQNTRRALILAPRLDIDFPESWQIQEFRNAEVEQAGLGRLLIRFKAPIGERGVPGFEERAFYDVLATDEVEGEPVTTECLLDYVGYPAAAELMSWIALKAIREMASDAEGLAKVASFLEAKAADVEALYENVEEEEVLPVPPAPPPPAQPQEEREPWRRPS